MASLHKSRLEVFKFVVYLGTPVTAVYFLAFGEFDILERSIDNRQYVVYPPEGPGPPKMRELEKMKGRMPVPEVKRDEA
jgi:protein PET100, fungi type